MYGNCQTNQLVYGLTLALNGIAQVQGIDTNSADAINKLKELIQSGQGVDFVVTNHNVHELIPIIDKSKIVEIPSIHFGGFHPDVVYFANQSTPDKPNFFMNNPTVSAIALWTVLNKVNIYKAQEMYNEQVFEQLGYMDYFDVSCQAIRDNYAQNDIPLSHIDRHLASRKVFMYGPLHPKFEVTLSLCFGICEKIGQQTAVDYDQIVNMVIDPLQNEYAWGCFPPLAKQLGVPGSWYIRHYGQIFPSTIAYLESFHRYISQYQSQHGVVQMIDRDKQRFDDFHKIDSVLGELL